MGIVTAEQSPLLPTPTFLFTQPSPLLLLTFVTFSSTQFTHQTNALALASGLSISFPYVKSHSLALSQSYVDSNKLLIEAAAFVISDFL